MINLLPEEYKKNIERKYEMRVFKVILLFILATLITATALLVPSYIISASKHDLAEERSLRVLSFNNEESSKIEAKIREVNVKLSIIKPVLEVPLHELIKLVVENKGNSVVIRSFNYESRGVTAKLDLLGVAKTREALLGFVDRLEKEKIFAEVYSPVSNLVKEKDIEFVIQIGIV